MNGPEWYDPLQDDGPLIADEAWWQSQHSENGSTILGSSWRAVALSTLPDAPALQPTLGHTGTLYPGKRHVFSGPQESAKTLYAYTCGLAVIRQDFKPIVVIDFEMGQFDCKKRFRELGATDAELAMTYYVEPESAAMPPDIAGLVALDPGLVIIDAAAGAYALEGLDDNKRSEVERFATIYVRPFWKAHIATVVLDHVAKSAEARGRYAIGSERKVGGADVHLGFDVIDAISRGGVGTYKITTHKDRGGFLRRGRLGKFRLSSNPDTHLLDWHLEPALDDEDEEHGHWRPTGYMEKVSRWLELQTGPVSRNAVETAITGNRDYVRRAMDELVLAGFAEERKGTNRARLLQALRAFREDDNPGSPEVRPSSPDSGRTETPAVVRLFAPTPTGGRSEQADEAEQKKSAGSPDDLPF